MKKIIIFTSAMDDNNFSLYQENAKRKSNPSNQNFYSRLIRSLSIFNDVSVISHRPISSQMFGSISFDSKKTNQDGVNYYYTYISTHLLYKPFHEFKAIYHEAVKCVNDLESNDFVIIVDVLRYNLLRAAKKLARKNHVPIFGMLTDNPKNISGVTRKYINKILSIGSKLDGYLALSDGLVKAFSNGKKPSYIFEGFVENIDSPKKEPLGNYLFFSGSLYERYGVKTMIDAYLSSSIKEKLIICGSGPLEQYIFDKERNDSRILYLSQLDRNKILSLQQHAIANINPRPLSNIDEESIPSKLLEYFASGTPTLSTKHPKLYNLFKDDAVWFNDGSFESLERTFNRFQEEYNYDSLKKMASSAKVKVFSLYDLRVQGEAITHFIDSFKNSEN